MTSELNSNLITYSPKSKDVFLPLSIPGGEPLNHRGIDAAGFTYAQGNYDVVHVNPPTHWVLITLDGSGHFCCLDKEGEARKGDLVFLPRGYSNRWKAAGNSWDFMFFSFSLHADWNFPNHPVLRQVDIHQLNSLKEAMEGLTRENPWKDEFYFQKTRRIYSELIITLLSNLLEFTEDITNWKHTIQGAISQISNNLGHPWTTSDIAKMCNTSQTHLFRIFREYIGMSPIEMLTKLRMERALELLATDQKLSVIASIVGYNSSFAFSKAFKRYFGVPPKEFQKKAKN